MPNRKPPADPYALHPRLAADSHPVANLALCELRLIDDANYPWLVLVPRAPDARELIDLDGQQRALLVEEIACCEQLLLDAFRPDKLNVAALGNMVPQLHVHVIARFAQDPAWPAPVWGRVAAKPYAPEALVACVRTLQSGLAALGVRCGGA